VTEPLALLATALLLVGPVLLGAPILVVMWHRGLRLTPLLYRLLFAHAVVLMIGGHYTYAEVPLRSARSTSSSSGGPPS